MRKTQLIDLFPDDANPSSLREYDSITFNTLAEWNILGARCKTCERMSVLNRYGLLKQRGDQLLRHLEPKLFCTHCQVRGSSKFLIGNMPR